MSKPDSAAESELEDRDPNNLNPHLRFEWSELVGEPGGARSPECAWRVAARAHRITRSACYTVLAVLLATPIAVLMGCCFATFAFQHIWCTVPCLKAMRVSCSATRTAVATCAQAVLAPVMDALGRVCRQVRVQQKRLPDGEEKESEDLLLMV